MSPTVEKQESSGLGRLFSGIMAVSTKYKKRGNLGEANNFYFHSELNRWVERGQEGEALAAPKLPPPPKTNHSLGSVTDARRRPLCQRYKLQDNLRVASRESIVAEFDEPSDLILPRPLMLAYPVVDRGLFLPPSRQGHCDRLLLSSGPPSVSSDFSSASSSTASSTRSNSTTSLVSGACTGCQSDCCNYSSSNSGRSSCEGSEKDAQLPGCTPWARSLTGPAPLLSPSADAGSCFAGSTAVGTLQLQDFQPPLRRPSSPKEALEHYWPWADAKPGCPGAATSTVSILCTFDSTQVVTQIAAALEGDCSSPVPVPQPCGSPPCSSSASVGCSEPVSAPAANHYGHCSWDPEPVELAHSAGGGTAVAAAVVLCRTEHGATPVTAAATVAAPGMTAMCCSAPASVITAQGSPGPCPHALLDSLCENAAALSRASSLSLSFSDLACFDSPADAEPARDQQLPPQQHLHQQHPPYQAHCGSQPQLEPLAQAVAGRGYTLEPGEAGPAAEAKTLLQPPPQLPQLQCGCCPEGKGCCSTFSFVVHPGPPPTSRPSAPSTLEHNQAPAQQHPPSDPFAPGEVDPTAEPGPDICVVGGCAQQPPDDGCHSDCDAAEGLVLEHAVAGGAADPSRPSAEAAAALAPAGPAAASASDSTKGAVDLAAVDVAVKVLRDLRRSLLGAASSSSAYVAGPAAVRAPPAAPPASVPCAPSSACRSPAAPAATSAIKANRCGDGSSRSSGRSGCHVRDAQPPAPRPTPAAMAVDAVGVSLAQAAQALADLGLLPATAASVVAPAAEGAVRQDANTGGPVEPQPQPQPQPQTAPVPNSNKHLKLETRIDAQMAAPTADSDNISTPEVSPRRSSLRTRSAVGTAAPATAAAGKTAVGSGSLATGLPVPLADPGLSVHPLKPLGLLRKIRGELAAVQGQLTAALDGWSFMAKHAAMVAARQRALERRCEAAAAAARQHETTVARDHDRERVTLERQLDEERKARAAAEARLAEERAARAELERQLQLQPQAVLLLEQHDGGQLGRGLNMPAGVGGSLRTQPVGTLGGSGGGCLLPGSNAQRAMEKSECEVAVLRAELDEMLLCLGQESTKVATLAAALRAAGGDPDGLIAEVESEYVDKGMV